MQNPGRGRSRLLVTCALALIGAALTPTAANADSISFGPGVEWIDAMPNETHTRTFPIRLDYDGASHLVPGSRVHLAAPPLDSAWTASDVAIDVPADWGLGKTAQVNATVTYTTGSTIFPTQANYLAWTPTSVSCALGGTSCLVVNGTRRVDVRNSPNKVGDVDATTTVDDALVTWEHSPEHLQLTHYRVIRMRRALDGSGFDQGKGFVVPATDPTFHDQGLEPGREYCWRVSGFKLIPIGESGSQVLPTPAPDPEVCERTGTHPAAPASGPAAAEAVDADGRFDLAWGASPDSGVSYELEHRDENDADWSPLASGVSGPSYSASEDEGTWRYRVRSRNAQRGWSDWVESTSPVKVDTTAPSARAATTDPAGPAFADWFRDSVTVSFGPSTDPGLPDGSAGSGVDEESYAGGETFSTSGTHLATGTVEDLAGHPAVTEKTVKVDATKPAASIVCPTGPVQLGSEATATWTAEDAHSGLATPASGHVLLDTSRRGTHTAASPAPEDNVGHTGNAATCEYEVNSPPTTPGTPAGPALDSDGSFALGWAAATDPDEGDSVEYTVQQRDANDAEWSDVPGRLDAATLAADLGEGTWTFRVKAFDLRGGESAWSDPSAPVKVDKSAPSAPATSTTDPAEPAYDGWFKDEVTVAFSGSSDPMLPDGSDGSGGLEYSAPQRFATSGSHAATGTATDHAGHASPAAGRTVKVDATAPAAEIACPSGSLIVGQTDATARWSAADGESGVKGDSSGTVALDTSAPGTYTATAPAPVDNVGHAGEAPRCSYTVAYRFTGFLSPINGDAVNTGKTGRTYPVKWRLQRHDGSLIPDAEAQALVADMTAGDKPSGCDFGLAEEDALEEAATGDTSLRYDAAADQFIYNYKAPSTDGCYVLGIRQADGALTRQVNFSFTR